MLPFPYFFSPAGNPRFAGQSRGGGGQPAESRAVPGQDEQADGLGPRHAPDDHDQRPELRPSAGHRPVSKLAYHANARLLT